MRDQNRIVPFRANRILFWLLAILLVTGASLIAGIVGGRLLSPLHPPDERLIIDYYEKKSELQRLAEMFQNEDNDLMVVFARGKGQCRMAEDYDSLLRASDDSRCYEAAHLLKALDLERADRGQGWLMVTASSFGLSVSGSSKGYFYSTTAPDPIVDDTDTYQPYEEVVFRHVEDDWYIFYDSN